MAAQTWANLGQNLGMSCTFKIKFGGASFTQVTSRRISRRHKRGENKPGRNENKPRRDENWID